MSDIQTLIDRRALFVANHSGGKDSQAMLIRMLALGVPRDQILVVHASLGEAEWPGALEVARDHAQREGLPFVVAHAFHADRSPASFFTLVERKHASRPEVPSFPSLNQRFCTSELKRGPITRETLAYMRKRGLRLVVNCMGLRADESDERKVLSPLARLGAKHRLAKAGREAWQWLPIHALATRDVFASIAAAGLVPHPAYAAGNDRLSCLFCIFGCKGDLVHAAREHPAIAQRLIALEARTGYTLHFSKRPLAELIREATLA